MRTCWESFAQSELIMAKARAHSRRRKPLSEIASIATRNYRHVKKLWFGNYAAIKIDNAAAPGFRAGGRFWFSLVHRTETGAIRYLRNARK